MSGVSMDLKCGCGCGQHVTLCRKKTQRKLSVLVVDDDPSMREVLTELLAILGHTVCVAADGVSAVCHLIQHPETEMVITDFRMPQMDGVELTKHIRATKPAGIKVIVMSGDDPDVIGKAALAAGADAFMQKPLSLSELKALADSVLS